MKKEIPFESEFILHTLTQDFLDELFGLEFVASEIQLNDLRLDNLAFDNDANSFVIIEYKNEFNANVLNQAQEYYDLLQENPEYFLNRLDNKEDVDFDNVKVMIIGPKFSDEQIKEAKDNFELWRITLFNDGEVSYENLKTNEIKSININLEDLKHSEDQLLEDKTEYMKELYFNLKENILNEFSDIELNYQIEQFSFRVNGKLVCVVKFLKSGFTIFFYANNLENIDNTTDISDKNTGGNANYNLKYKSDEDYEYFLDLFKQSYNQKV